MIYSVYTKTWAETYKDVMFYFNRDVLNNGEQFFKDFGKYLDTTKFPCDKLILCISHSGDMRRFAFYFNYNNAKIGYVELMHDKDLDLFDVRRIYFENEAYNIFNLIKNLVDENGVIQIRKEPDFGRYGATCYRLTLGNSYYLHICFHDEYDRNKIWVCYKKQDTTIYSYNVRKEMENYIQTLYRDTMKKVLS